MKIEKQKNKIVIFDPEDFDVKQTLECGQIFRYTIFGNEAEVFSMDKKAVLRTFDDTIEIDTEDVDYFYRFFDFETDYSKIKKELKKDRMLLKAVDYGGGIRILNNDIYEIIISFIISANNNISRIKKSIEWLCVHFGKKMKGYYAFPTLKELKNASLEDYRKAGLGYRAEYMLDTVKKLTDQDVLRLTTKDKKEQYEFLLSLKGVGEKVANCIMLFGLGVKDVFPVDTWINKVYNDIYNTTEKNRKKITKELTNRFKDLSGYAQQYFFYYYRDNKK